MDHGENRKLVTHDRVGHDVGGMRHHCLAGVLYPSWPTGVGRVGQPADSGHNLLVNPTTARRVMLGDVCTGADKIDPRAQSPNDPHT